MKSTRIFDTMYDYIYLKIIFICFILQYQICANVTSNPQPRHPFMVLIDVNHSDGSQICAGTLIGTRHVLTAAHCLMRAVEAYVLLGSNNLYTEKPESTVTQVYSTTFISHHNYNESTLDNDIGLIVLDNEVALSVNIQLVSLFVPRMQETVFTHQYQWFEVLGWADENPDIGLHDTLLVKNVTVVDNFHCFSQVSDESRICGIGVRGICHGDSGGPLLWKNFQIGVVSGGSEYCNQDIGVWFTYVPYYLDWIKEKTMEL